MRRLSIALLEFGLVGCSASHAAVGALPDGGATDAAAAETCAGSVTGIQVAEGDLYAYPPYAASGCSLVYVAGAGAAAGELRLRDLSSGSETTLAPASDAPARPSIDGDTIAWEAKVGATAVVRVRYKGNLATVAGAFDHASEPRANATGVAFTAWKASALDADTDVLLYHPDTTATDLVAGGPAQQRFADISDTHVAFTDFAEDPGGFFDESKPTLVADVATYERATRLVSPYAKAGKQAFPILATSGVLGFLDWGLVHPEPKFAMFDLNMATIGAFASTDVNVAHIQDVSGSFVRPAARGGVMAWIQNPSGTPALWSTRVDGAPAPVQATGLDGLYLYAPALESGAMILATRASTGPALLRGVSR